MKEQKTQDVACGTIGMAHFYRKSGNNKEP
jgi:hypothetical protein